MYAHTNYSTPCDVLTSFADPPFYKKLALAYETDSAAQNQQLSFVCQWSSYGPVGVKLQYLTDDLASPYTLQVAYCGHSMVEIAK
jgi:hypothetical protein